MQVRQSQDTFFNQHGKRGDVLTRPKRHYMIKGASWGVRTAYSAVCTFGDAGGLWGNLDLTALAASAGGEAAIVAFLSLGSFYTNFGFWGREAQKHFVEIATYADKHVWGHKKREYIQLEGELAGDDSSDDRIEIKTPAQKDFERISFIMLSPQNWGITFSGTFFVVRQALKNQYVLNLATDTNFVLAFSLSSATIATVYSIFTESLSIWQEIHGNNHKHERPTNLAARYALATTGALNENIKFTLPMYILLREWVSNLFFCLVAAIVLGVCNLLQTFYFQSGVLIENTQFKESIDRKVASLDINKRYALCVAIALNQSMVSLSGYKFTAQEIYGFFNERYFNSVMSAQLIQGLAYTHGLVGMAGDLLSETVSTAKELTKSHSEDEMADVEVINNSEGFQRYQRL